MHLAAYHFTGDPDELTAGYDRLQATFPEGVVELNLCVARDGGIVVYDACPTVQDFEAFSSSADFRDALAAAGLPAPRIESLGTVYAANGTALAPVG